MTHFYKNYLCAALMAGLLLAFTAPHAYASGAGSDIQMLPPLSLGTTTPCNSPLVTVGHPSFLAWDGSDPINCITSITSDTGGNVSIATPLTLNDGLTVNINPLVANAGVITGDLKLGTTDVTAPILSLAGLSCPSYEAMTTNPSIPGTFMCIAVTDIVGVGVTTMPSCAMGQEIYFNGVTKSFSCIVIGGLPSCPAGTTIYSNPTTGVLSCQASFAVCPTGQFETYDGTSVTCAAPILPAPPTVPTVPASCNDNYHALRSDANSNLVCSQTSCYYNGNAAAYGYGTEPYVSVGGSFVNPTWVTPAWVPFGMAISVGNSDDSVSSLTCSDAINNVFTASQTAPVTGGGSGTE